MGILSTTGSIIKHTALAPYTWPKAMMGKEQKVSGAVAGILGMMMAYGPAVDNLRNDSEVNNSNTSEIIDASIGISDSVANNSIYLDYIHPTIQLLDELHPDTSPHIVQELNRKIQSLVDKGSDYNNLPLEDKHEQKESWRQLYVQVMSQTR